MTVLSLLLSVTGAMAFSRCDNLKGIVIPRTVSQIGEYALGYDNLYGEDILFEPIKIEGFTIYGYTCTVAETYANENDITFIALDDATNPTLGDANGDGEVNAKDRMMLQDPDERATAHLDLLKFGRF